jgi:hypothetical protein
MNQSDDLLLAGIRQKILTGTLPKENCRMTWYGRGTGAVCVACDQPIVADDSEVECDLPNGGTIRLHRACYDIWTAEWPTCEGP